MPTFENDQDRERAQAVAREIEAAWHCELHEFGDYSPLDWFAQRDRRLMAVLELKCRLNRASDSFPTTMLSVRKWWALTQTSWALQCSGLFVVRFSDGIFWLDVTTLDTSQNCVAGRKDRQAFYAFDVEPVIEFPVSALTKLSRSAEASHA